jgi:hypothetical protein
MKPIRTLAIFFFLLMNLINVMAQEITNEELKKYVLTMDSLDVLKNQLTIKINNISKNSKISPDRFNKLMPIINDQAKLTEANATADEITIIKKAVALRNEETMKFQQTYQALIHDFLGQAIFTKVRNALKTNDSIKRKYDSLTAKPIRP